MVLSATTLTLTACGGGGGGDDGGATTGGATTFTVGGGGTKGPLANAVVTIYALDYSQTEFKGAVVGSATTNNAAQISGLSLPFPVAAPYLMEFTSTPGTTTDLTTGDFPVISTLRTVLTQSLLESAEQVYATPLTTMAVDLAISNADSLSTPTAAWAGNNDAVTTESEFLAALPVAGLQVASTLGFGIDSTVDIFDTPPLIDSTTDTLAEQTATAQYRAAIEAVTAIAYQISEQAPGDADAILAELTDDLADGSIDGTVDGSTSTVFTSTSLDVLEQDPSTLLIPGTTTTIADIEDILDSETAQTGTTTDTTALTDGSIIVEEELAPAETNPDIDGDGVLNSVDAFPTDSTESVDTDGDGIGNAADTDDDNDGVLDGPDDFPLDADETTDTDNDGTGNNADLDDDNDGTLDIDDDFPLDSTKQNATDVDNDGWPAGQDADDNDAANPGTAFVDTDGDGIGNATDTDDDNDGVLDGADDFSLDATETTDTDNDGTGNNADTDDDGDTVLDGDDAFPLDSTESKDTDNDGVGNNTDTDDDNDGLLDTAEDAETADVDSDGIPNREDIDSDGDGYLDSIDLDPYDAAVQINNAPFATSTNISLDEDIATGITLVAADDIDAAGALTYTVLSTTSNGVLTGAGNSLTYTPSAEFSGTDTLTFKATDSSAADSNIATINITVNAVNDAPVAVDDAAATAEDTPIVFAAGAGLVNDTDVEGDILTATNALNAINGSISIASDGSVTFIPAVNFSGAASFDYTISDGNGGTDTGTVNITVAAVNDAPVAVDDVATTAEDTPIVFAAGAGLVNDTDAEGDTLTATGALNAVNGTISIDGVTDAVTFTPTLNFVGPASFDYTISDGNGGTDTGTVNIDVTPVNDAPVIAQASPLAVTMDEDGAPTAFVAPTISATDEDTLDTLAWNLSAGANNGTATVSGTGASPTISYVPTANFNGSDSFDIQVVDGNGGVDTITVDVTINAQPDLPTISGTPSTTATEGVLYSFTPTGNDVDGDSLVFSIQNQPTWATTFDTATGELSGTPANGDIGTDATIIISVTANGDTVALAAFDITVSAAPVGGAVWDSFNWDDGSTWQ